MLLACVALDARRARAADAIQLQIPDCAGVSGAAVAKLVALEVVPRPVYDPRDPRPVSTRVRLECLTGAARIWVEDERRSAPLRLEVTLSDLASSARPRLLALAIAELIATSRLEQASARQAQQAEEATSQIREEPSRSSAGLQLWLGGGASCMGKPVVLTPGAVAGSVLGLDWLALGLELRYEHGQSRNRAQDVGLNLVSAGVSPAVRMRTRSVQLLLGPGVRVGYGELRGLVSGTALEGETHSGFWFGPYVQTSAQLALARRLGLRVGVEVGYATRALLGLDAHRHTLLDLAGPWLALHAGIGWDAVGTVP